MMVMKEVTPRNRFKRSRLKLTLESLLLVTDLLSIRGTLYLTVLLVLTVKH